MVDQPACRLKDGSGTDPGGLRQFNAAYAIGGPACTIKTVETLTGVRIQHFVVVDFVGFRSMVNALDGVTVCVPTEVNDTVGHIKLPAGTYKVDGQQALDYVRVRHDLGAPTGDIGRMKRQQAFISAMIKKVVSAGTLANPVRLYSFLDAATKSLTTDPGFAHLKELVSLGSQLKGIGLDHVQFVTVPFQTYEPGPEPGAVGTRREAVVAPDQVRQALGPKFTDQAVSPGSGTSTAGSTAGPSGSPSSPGSRGRPAPSPASPTTQDVAKAKEQAAANGLCA